MVVPTEQSTSLHHQHEVGGEIEEDIEADNPKYSMTKENLKKITKEIAVSRKMKTNQGKGKGKCQLILSESEDEEEILATSIDIIEDDATKNIGRDIV